MNLFESILREVTNERARPLDTLFGIPVVESRSAVERVRVERRVRGGYMNRWLIREVAWEWRPCAYIIGPGATWDGRQHLVLHPQLMAHVKLNFKLEDVR